jgi:hypothetical protein
MIASCRLCGARAWMLVAMGCGLPMAFAQQADPTTGTVMGQVVCGDTQLPARLAGVILIGVPSAPGLTSQPNTGQGKAATEAFDSGEKVQVVTGLDGGYTATHLVPGDYYAFPLMAGYAQPAAVVQTAIDAGADMTKPIPGIPIVHVAAGGTARQDLTLVRGGAVSGHVLWDDGSPIPRAVVTVQLANGDGKKPTSRFGSLEWASAMMGGGTFSTTDDLGQYRITGLAPGKYVAVGVVVGTGEFATHAGKTMMRSYEVGLTAYASESFRRRGAKPIDVSAGQEQIGEDITFSLTGTHSVSGRIVSAEDGHEISSGVVELRDGSDTALTRSAHVDSSGNFMVQAVPSGSYNVTVRGAVDVGRSYAEGTQSVVVGDSDVTGLSVALQVSKNAKAGMNLN